jgi:hypothetical protein
MSNEIALFNQEVPAYLKEVGLDNMTKALAQSASPFVAVCFD